MTTRQTAHEIDMEATDWVAKVDRGLSDEEQAGLDRWLSGDQRRVGAYGRIRAIALQTERVAALGPVHSPHEFGARDRATFTRRKLLANGSVLAAALTAFGLGGWAYLKRGQIHTRKGEFRQLALQDGSVVTLNTASRVSVRLSGQRREIDLMQGEVLFDVAKDRLRPFVVTAGELEIRVLGTSFSVRNLPDEPVQVMVREGVVEIARTGGIGPKVHRLLANMRASASASGDVGDSPPISVSELPEAEIRRALAWRDGNIDFEGESLARAVAEFSRYSDTRIVIAPALANEQIAGLFQASDPVGFARAVAMSLRAKTAISEGEIRITQ